ncbi:ligand-binding sensor domain-containing protein [Telluribacter sp.]|jgi:ligand-binding sensor domain-containing protein|uniref:ligand-binding sensor domain-containing protein n=1 Tax=Telluribacter sp. TaxID=1978767 RepID=UPI002E0D5DEB|nr:two-component regulator propeller domain-containing protein [Telluribacter sp.]
MKHVSVFILFLMFVFCNLCTAQNKKELPSSTTLQETKGVITSYGPSTSVRTITQDKKGNLWLASNEGIVRYDGKSFTNITGDRSTNRFFSVLEDRKGNFWFGNHGSGVYYYDPKRAVGKSLQHFTTSQGLVDNGVVCIYEDRTGNIWFGTRGGASRYDGKSFQNFTTKDGLPDNSINSIIEDKTGKLWFGTSGNTGIYDGKTFAILTANGTFSNVWSIIEDKTGNIWLGGGNGLRRYNGSTSTTYTENFVGYVYEDKKGNIWTSGRNDNGVWVLSRYDEKSMSTNKPIVIEITHSLNLFGMLEANDGSIWFGSFDGVYRYDGTTITDFKK